MNRLFIAGLLVCAGLATSADDVVSGVVLEVKDGEAWAAVGRAPVQVGATVSIGDALLMEDFESKALKKVFPSIVFGSLAGSGKIVKFNPAIMGKNWIHLRDGSGSAADNSHDILVSTQAKAKLGDEVTVSV